MDRRTLEQISAALGLGFVLDDALIALAIHGGERAGAEEPEAIAPLRAWLETTKQLIGDPSRIIVSEQNFAFAPYSSVSVGLVGREVASQDRKQLMERLARLLDTVNGIEHGTAVSQEAVSELTDFLELASRALLQVAEEKSPHAGGGVSSTAARLTLSV